MLDLYEKINAVILIVLIEKYLVTECKHLALRDGPFDIRGGGGSGFGCNFYMLQLSLKKSFFFILWQHITMLWEL